MELAKRAVVLVVSMVAFCGVVSTMAEVYKVGEANGWTNTAQFNYMAWAASKTFHVGDTIVFQYKPQFQNVVRVSHKNFNTCNTTTPYHILTTGNDSFVIPKHGHFYFICGLPGHCQSGQKVDIRVPKSSTSAHHPPSEAPSLPPSPSPSDSDRKSASAPLFAHGGFWLSAAVLTLSVFGFAY